MSCEEHRFFAQLDTQLLYNFHQVRNLGYHAADGGIVRALDHLIQPGKPQSFYHSFCLTGAQMAERTHFSWILPPEFVFFAVILPQPSGAKAPFLLWIVLTSPLEAGR